MSKALKIVKIFTEQVDEEWVIQELISEFPDAEKEIRDSFDFGGRYGSWVPREAGSFVANGIEYNWVSNYETFKNLAIDVVRDSLESEPELFNQDWLQEFLFISDTDKRIIASEEAEAQAEAEEFETDEEREEWIEKRAEEIESELDDPVQYFVHDTGIYSIEDLMKQNFIMIDVERAARDAVNIDSPEHFLSLYDGSYNETKGGVIYFRE